IQTMSLAGGFLVLTKAPADIAAPLLVGILGHKLYRDFAARGTPCLEVQLVDAFPIGPQKQLAASFCVTRDSSPGDFQNDALTEIGRFGPTATREQLH